MAITAAAAGSIRSGRHASCTEAFAEGAAPRRRPRPSRLGPVSAALGALELAATRGAIAYPYGETPVPSRRDDPPRKAQQSRRPCVDPWLARVRAEAEARAEALQRHGVPQYHGPDEPVTYVFREIE